MNWTAIGGKQHTVAVIAIFALCSAPASAADNFWKRSYGPDRALIEDLARSEKRFVDAQTAAIADPAKNAEYVQSGITVSDLTCGAWLESLGRSDRDVSLFKGMLNIVGNLILGVAGINGANPSSLAKGALGLSAANASVDEYRAEVLLGAISDIEDKLKSGRRVSAAYFVANVPVSYDESQRRLFEYHDGCSPNAIKVLLKGALAQVKYVAPDTTLTGPIAQAEADDWAGKLYNLMFKAGEPPPSDEALYRLWVSQVAYVNDQSDVIKNMRADPNVARLSTVFQTNKELFSPYLGRIAELRGYKKRVDGELAKEKSDKAAAAKMAADADVAAKKVVLADAQKLIEKKAADVEAASATKPEAKSSASNLSLLIKKPLLFPSVSGLGLDEAMKASEEHARTFPSAEAAELSASLAKAKEKQIAFDEAQARLRSLEAAPAPRGGGAPPSISAILVPVGK